MFSGSRMFASWADRCKGKFFPWGLNGWTDLYAKTIGIQDQRKWKLNMHTEEELVWFKARTKETIFEVW